ncbi:long-chain specific acyl-CoA dehydrogenase, mitochondrial-like [Apostichopus japonicus]|uniref:long-chain specific acyl-CoA dehydrogenase, mitochondrial-like n=1 Tax=Stichopus japonicus TaxID=307972 RepID=UPI003AB1D629
MHNISVNMQLNKMVSLALFSKVPARCIRNPAVCLQYFSRYQHNNNSTTENEESPKPWRPEPGQVENMMEIGTRDVFTEEHDIFRRSIRKFFQEEILPNQMRYEEQGHVDRELWAKLGAAGMLGISAPAEMGGVGGDFKYAAIFPEEQGYSNDAGTSGWQLHNDIIMPYVVEYGTPEQQEKYVPGMAAGTIIGAIAMTEPQAGSDLQGIKTTAKRDGDDWILNGNKVFITNGYLCDMAVVVAITDLAAKRQAHGISLFLVDADTPGFHKGKPLKKIGQRSADTAELFFEDVRLPKEALLGGANNLNKGFYFLMNQLPRERLILSLGVQAHSECMFEMTREYVTKRKAFGKTLSKLQTIQHRMAEMKTEICITRTFADKCLQMYCENRLDNATVSMLKYWTTDLATRVAGECVQLHGGWGYMWEYPIARAFAATKVYPIYTGSNEIMKELIARDICSEK